MASEVKKWGKEKKKNSLCVSEYGCEAPQLGEKVYLNGGRFWSFRPRSVITVK